MWHDAPHNDGDGRPWPADRASTGRHERLDGQPGQPGQPGWVVKAAIVAGLLVVVVPLLLLSLAAVLAALVVFVVLAAAVLLARQVRRLRRRVGGWWTGRGLRGDGRRNVRVIDGAVHRVERDAFRR
jgi:hypothetical protein